MVETLSPERVAEIRALAEKATPGPWQDKHGEYRQQNECAEIIGNVDADYTESTWRWIYTEVCSIADSIDHDANAAYIAALDPQTVLALLASHEALRAEVERLKNDLHQTVLEAGAKVDTARATAAREMREAAAKIVADHPCSAASFETFRQLSEAIESLPLPSETKETV